MLLRITQRGHWQSVVIDGDLAYVPAGSLTVEGAETGGVLASVVIAGVPGDWEWFPTVEDAVSHCVAAAPRDAGTIRVTRRPAFGLGM